MLSNIVLLAVAFGLGVAYAKGKLSFASKPSPQQSSSKVTGGSVIIAN